MPLNDHPSAKPTYDFYDTVNAGKTAVANGMLLSTVHNPPDAQFPGGSTTWHWHSPAPDRELPGREQRRRLRPDLARRRATASATTRPRPARIDAAQKQANLAIMDQQQDITDFQSQFNGPFPFTSDGVLVGIPEAGFEEEMQTMITFQGGQIDLRHVLPREHAPVVGRQRHRGQLQPDLLQGRHGHARRVPVRRPQRGDRSRRPGHAGRRRRRSTRAWSTSSTRTTRTTAALDRRAVRPDAGHGCSPAPSPTPAPAPPTSRCARSSARPTSPARCSRSSATTATPASPRRSWRPGSTRWHAEPERGVQRPARPVLHPVVRHRLPARRRREPAAAHRSRPGRPRLLQRGRHLRLSLIG